jgi:hypothetical protein
VNRLLEDIAAYYGNRLRMYGTTPQGVDWKDRESQVLRFSQLLRVVQMESLFTLNDLGCGYGGLYDFILETGVQSFCYRGYDLSETMIDAARSLHAAATAAEFCRIAHPGEMSRADYTVASGIFNVRMRYTEDEWLPYVLGTLDSMHECSGEGFAFNMLTSYSDPDRIRQDLYYADPCFIFDRCKRRFSRNVALLHDYGLYEFTVIVRRN